MPATLTLRLKRWSKASRRKMIPGVAVDPTVTEELFPESAEFAETSEPQTTIRFGPRSQDLRDGRNAGPRAARYFS